MGQFLDQWSGHTGSGGSFSLLGLWVPSGWPPDSSGQAPLAKLSPTSAGAAASARPIRGILEYHRRAFLADHDGRRVGVACNDTGHDRRVGHAQSRDAVHAQTRVHNRVHPVAHAAGADGMEIRHAALARYIPASPHPIARRGPAGFLPPHRVSAPAGGDLAARCRPYQEWRSYRTRCAIDRSEWPVDRMRSAS